MMAFQGINHQDKSMSILRARFDSIRLNVTLLFKIGFFRPHSESDLAPFICESQYKVFQDGCWTKIDFKKDQPQLNKTSGSAAVLASPWIKHFKSAGRHQTRVNSDLQGNTTLVKQNQSPVLCHKDYVTGSWDFQSACVTNYSISISSH